MKTPLIVPSILAADFAHLAKDVATVANADAIHVDIMDGHFVPNLSFGPDITATVNRITDQPLDVHLMIQDPQEWVETYAKAGADTIIFHGEAVDGLEAAVALAKKIRSLGVKSAFSIKPHSPIEPWLQHLEHFDEVLIMSVEPGFGGQKFMPEVLEKVRSLRATIDAEGHSTIIEIDGGIAADTIAQAAAAGCDAFVAGSAIFKEDDRAAMIDKLRELASS